MKLIGYVSDDRYVALVDVAGEFQNEATGEITILRSSPRGTFYGALATGYCVRYRSGTGSRSSVAYARECACHTWLS